MDSMETTELLPPMPNVDGGTFSGTVQHTPFITALICGGFAGTSVDVALFPIDTIKTRLQSPQGFLGAGGFRGVYRGLSAISVGSFPGAAMFFSTYETLKPRAHEFQKRQISLPNDPALSHMFAACVGETAACLIRVPTEVIKSKMQTNQAGAQNLFSTLRMVLSEGGYFTPLGGLYRGFGMTVMREIPFALLQFPIYERTKVEWSKFQQKEVSPLQAAACGCFGGAVAAACTTPLDVIKTRLMLGFDGDGRPYRGGLDVAKRIWKEEGGSIFFKGIQPRVMWISIGGFVFFGAYESLKKFASA